MSDADPVAASVPTRRALPLILIRGFGSLGVEDEKQMAYQGFNDGTVYPQKRGENYIYEGLILRFMKSDWQYYDATNVVGYYGSAIAEAPTIPALLAGFDASFFSGDKIVIDPAMALALRSGRHDVQRSLWVFRYYDLNDRTFPTYGRALVRLIDFIRALAQQDGGEPPKVNIIAHSMGGLLVREAIQNAYPAAGRHAVEHINKVVTLGTPHQGISFQLLQNWIPIDAADELEHFNPNFQANPENPAAFTRLHEQFPLDRFLTVIGTNYRSYGTRALSLLNRLFSVSSEYGPTYNRSDGLVKQAFAQIPGAPRTFVHKCHGGPDSLVTSREGFEVATRFFFGNVRARLRLVQAKVLRGLDWFGKSEIFFGVSIKPRRVDFDLFHQSAEAENCYGPFSQVDLVDEQPAFGWAGPDRLIWEGYLDVSRILEDESITLKDMVLRADIYVGERDAFGIGFSDNAIFRKQVYVRAVMAPALVLYCHPDERFADPAYQARPRERMNQVKTSDGEFVGWQFTVGDSGFEATFQVELDAVPEVGHPQKLVPRSPLLANAVT
jgi:pimeloyl-ACP methyl ester carboxylesterase